MRTVDLIAKQEKSDCRVRRKCLECDNPTGEKKPYCIDHLAKNSDYVAKLMQDATPDSPEDEVLSILFGQALTIKAIIAKTQLTSNKIDQALRSLVKQKKVRVEGIYDIRHATVLRMFSEVTCSEAS